MIDFFWKVVFVVWVLYMINVFMPDLIITLEPHRELFIVALFLNTWILVQVIAWVAIIVIGVRWVIGDSR